MYFLQISITSNEKTGNFEGVELSYHIYFTIYVLYLLCNAQENANAENNRINCFVQLL
jgi:hypothetical protein